MLLPGCRPTACRVVDAPVAENTNDKRHPHGKTEILFKTGSSCNSAGKVQGGNFMEDYHGRIAVV